jgi:hypothetical protein
VTFWSSMGPSNVGWRAADCVAADCCAVVVLTFLVLVHCCCHVSCLLQEGIGAKTGGGEPNNGKISIPSEKPKLMRRDADKREENQRQRRMRGMGRTTVGLVGDGG